MKEGVKDQAASIHLLVAVPERVCITALLDHKQETFRVKAGVRVRVRVGIRVRVRVGVRIRVRVRVLPCQDSHTAMSHWSRQLPSWWRPAGRDIPGPSRPERGWTVDLLQRQLPAHSPNSGPRPHGAAPPDAQWPGDAQTCSCWTETETASHIRCWENQAALNASTTTSTRETKECVCVCVSVCTFVCPSVRLSLSPQHAAVVPSVGGGRWQ